MPDIFVILCLLQHSSWGNFPLNVFGYWLYGMCHMLSFQVSLKVNALLKEIIYLFFHILLDFQELRRAHESTCLLQIQDPIFEIQI